MSLASVSDKTITKFDINGKAIYVKISWEKSEKNIFKIKIFDDNNSWSGYFDTESAEQCRKNVDEDEKDYLENVKMCLTNQCERYLYEFTSVAGEVDTATFKWKKKFEGTTTVLVHGSVQLSRDVLTVSKNTLIDILLNENKEQRQIIENINKANRETNIEMDKLKVELIKFVDIKNSLEDTLYGKFVSVLNTKKRRIQLLEDHLQNCKKSNCGE